jgi:uroporphyrin-III C-methyltransferase/precorrin-2 dehydrogenase/sirohydrochlorin ferrochelatase
MKRFPLFVNLNKNPVLVVGGGDIAERKIKLILKANAKVEILAKSFSANVNKLIDENKLIKIKGSLDVTKLKINYSLIIAATDKKTINKKLYKFAEKNNILINVVDDPDLCSCTFGSLVDRGDLVVAISSGGSAPVFARHVREKIETMLPHSISEIIKFSGLMRKKVAKSFAKLSQRRVFWESFFEKLSTTQNIQPKKLKKIFEEIIFQEKKRKNGEVFLVGSGPGDPDLLTIRALHLMQKADVCIYDNLVSKDILELVRRDAELIYAGKLRSKHTVEQKTINKMLVKFAKQGMRVLRLKGGDPFIFGRGGEEIEQLMSQKINFQVVPGITSAIGVSAYAGIPLTHRDYAQNCIFLTGHEKDGELKIGWSDLVRKNQTIVIYMGLHTLSIISEELIKAGMSRNMPIAVVQEGTRKNQKVLISTLSRVVKKVEKENIVSPALLIIGEVVRLRKQMKWFN